MPIAGIWRCPCYFLLLISNDEIILFLFSTYNADFDGDEMNVHFPQDEISRAEAINIVDANKQYIGPRSGEAVRGLIQVILCICRCVFHHVNCCIVSCHMNLF